MRRYYDVHIFLYVFLIESFHTNESDPKHYFTLAIQKARGV